MKTDPRNRYLLPPGLTRHFTMANSSSTTRLGLGSIGQWNTGVFSRYRTQLPGTTVNNQAIGGRRAFGGGPLPVVSAFTAMNAYWLLLALNAVPFGLWMYAAQTRNRNLDVKLRQNTLVSVENVDCGRWWTILTSAFSHQSPTHIAFNLFTMHTMCQFLSFANLSGLHVLGIALGSGIAGSYGFLVQKRAQRTQGKTSMARAEAYHASALGASGAVMGLAAVATCFFPFQSVTIFPIPIPMPLSLVTVGYFVIDAYRLDSTTTRTAHAGHLGGFAFGLISYFVVLKSMAPVGVWYMLKRFLGRR